MAGINLRPIFLPAALVDDPKVKLSLIACRLLLYLCKYSMESPITLTQDDLLNGRTVRGVRQDAGAKLSGPRHLIRARKELIALGWLKCEKHLNRMVYTLTLPTSRNGN